MTDQSMKTKVRLIEKLYALIREAGKAGAHDPMGTLAIIFEAKKKMKFFKIKNNLK
ncbi:hypothetical protein PITCH_A720011 [uncultured Desulfobacterium sp.]|uniref:Uncharacterized protein n=1 Tax=uncultured Desulfobacterium sp. TaxID=201089 RepID=A0A445N1V5_9BACT|nr:hypothetical protein PITCH_A230005 [uncultured Desulfobacterium sp.]SPD75671.1 hypothetical protein PITCH_A720011 [uncultured Desulfobacterium sp.]